jgi:chemotaxis protein CheD
MKNVVVGVSDCKLCGDTESTLVTYALGSCIAVSIYDPALRKGGMLHYMLPESSIDPEKGRQNPNMFADTGIGRLLKAASDMGMNLRRLVVHLAGGAQVLDPQGTFQIGKRNYLAAKKILWKAGVLIAAEAVGGEVSRTVRLEVGSGKFWIRESAGAEKELTPGTAASKGAATWLSAR